MCGDVRAKCFLFSHQTLDLNRKTPQEGRTREPLQKLNWCQLQTPMSKAHLSVTPPPAGEGAGPGQLSRHKRED